MGIDSQPVKARVEYGKQIEEKIMKCLNENYSGYNLIPGTSNEDCKEKTDCWQVFKNGKKCRVAIKARVSKNDILICARDPFYGFDNEKTKIGRDVLIKYDLYITLSKDENIIRVANGNVIHKIYNVLWEELLESRKDDDINKSPYVSTRSSRLLASQAYPGCEVWFHRDRFSGNPKILVFVPPSSLKVGKEIKFHNFI